MRARPGVSARPQTVRFANTVAAGLLCALAGAAVSQEPQEPATPAVAPVTFGETVDVELVNVDVWVTDRKGNAVEGLGAADFEVLHDGDPVAISHLTEVRAGTKVAVPEPVEQGAEIGPGGGLPPTASGLSAAELSHHVVLYFDRSRLHPSNYPPLIRGLEDFLYAEGIEPERVLVLRQDRSLTVEAPFGSSRKELTAALERLSTGTASGMDLQAEADQALEAVRRSWEENQDFAGSAATALAGVPSANPGAGANGSNIGGPRAVVGGVGTGGGPEACGSFLSQIQPVLTSWARASGRRTAVTLANLSDITSFLAGLRGIKTLLYLSDGLATEPGAALATYASGFCPAASSQLLSDALSEEITPRFLELTRHANANRVTIYALQATGLRSSRGESASAGSRARGGVSRGAGTFDRSRRNSDRRGLELIARETGGRVVLNQNEFGDELDRIAREMGTYYSLAYEPPAGGDVLDHRIEVRVSDGSLNARYRRGYLEKSASRWLLERIEGALNLGISDNPLEVRLGAGELSSGGEGSFRLPLHVMVPVERLAFMPRQEGASAEIVVRVLARNTSTRALVMFDKTFVVPGSPGATGFADLTIVLELPEGTHLTAVGVQDTTSREASFVSTTLQIGSGG